MMPAAAERTVNDWLTESRRRGSVLPVLGPAGVGKTAFLKRLHEQFPSSIYIECSGLTVDEVARRLLAEFSIDAVDLWSKDPLFDAVVKIRRDAIILLADVQWAGPLFTSREPDRIAGSLATTFAAHSHGCVRLVVEADSPRDRVSVRRANEIILDEEPTTSDRLTTAASSSELRALRALAASEVHDTPLAVWQHLCSALGERTDAASLRRLAERLPDTVHLHETATGAGVRFTSRSLKYDIRSHNPLTATEHLAIAEALLTSARAEETTPVRAYGVRAAALHAALGGALPRLLDERPDFVALCDRTGLLEALSVAWPKGVPTGGTATDAHYLDVEGVAPRSHREWLAWLHWAAVNRGRTDWANALAETVRLPWRTAWSRWRPYGVFGKHPGTSGAVDYVELGLSDDVPVVTTQRELPLPADDESEERGDERYRERVWRLTDGAEIAAPSVVDVYLGAGGEVDRVVGRTVDIQPPAPAHPDVPRPQVPRSVRDMQRTGDSRWVLGGYGGVFALDVLEPDEVAEAPKRWPSPLVAPVRRTAVWPMPGGRLAAEGPDRSWFATAFGEEILRRLEPSSIPAGVVHLQARATLTSIGFPALAGGEPRFLTTVDLDQAGLEPVDLPAHIEPTYRLGFWLGEEVVLEGGSGRVLLASVTGVHLLGSTLRQFMTLVSLYVTLRRSEFSTRYEEEDARRSLTAWAQQIDQSAGSSPAWTAAFDGDLDVPESL
ncbi:ATP-binding protein [Streptomyces sp. NPDC004822]